MKKHELEQFFKMPTRVICRKLHLEQGVSLNELSKRCGITRQTITNIFIKEGLPFRSVAEATKLTTNKGKNHWMFGKTKKNSKFARRSSQRMKRNNPTSNKDTLERMARTRAKTFRKKPWPQEVAFRKILRASKVEFIFQHPISSYIIDFFVPRLNLCIEIDSTGNWGRERYEAAEVRDEFLGSLGYGVLRIDKRLVGNRKRIFEILHRNYVIR